MKTIAIIPARAGSKGIPGKNTMMLDGHSLISYTISSAVYSKYIDEVYVSTDIENLKIKIHSPKIHIIKRPKQLCGDAIGIEPVILHVLNRVKGRVDLIAMLQPTSPLRKATDLDSAFKLFLNSNYDTMFSASQMKDPCIWTMARVFHLRG